MNISIDSDHLQPALRAKEAEQMIIKNLPSIDHHNEGIKKAGIKETIEP